MSDFLHVRETATLCLEHGNIPLDEGGLCGDNQLGLGNYLYVSFPDMVYKVIIVEDVCVELNQRNYQHLHL